MESNECNMVVRYLFLVMVLQWDPNRPNSLVTFLGHTQLVYNAMWSPHVPSCFASVSGKYDSYSRNV
jgi:hypothetical protein